MPATFPVLVVQVVCGDEHTVCLTDAGRVVAFGSGEHGQLGSGGARPQRSPVFVGSLGTVREIAAGGDWTLFRGRGSKVYMAGKGSEPSEADGRLLRQILPVR